MNILKYRDRESVLGAIGKSESEGIITLRAIDRSGRIRRERTFNNLLTNTFLNRVFAFSTSPNIYVGTGTTVPQPTDVSLANFGARVNPNNNNIAATLTNVPGTAPYTAWAITITSAIGFFSSPITEIGVNVGGNNQNQLTARALVLDTAGNPAAFPIFEDEQLSVSYEIRHYIPTADVVSEIMIGSVPTVATVRPCDITSVSRWNPSSGWQVSGGLAANAAFSGDISVQTASAPSGTNLGGVSSLAAASYVENSFKRQYTAVWPIASGNGTIKSIRLASLGNASYQIQYSPPIVKTSDDTLTLGFETAWGRHVPE